VTTTLSHRALGSISLDDAAGRTVTGLAAPFGVTTEIFDKTGRHLEQMSFGAFSRSIAARPKIPLRGQHDGQRFPIGLVSGMSETPRGLEIKATIAETQRGDEALALLQQGIVSGLSIGGYIIRTSRRRGIVIVEEFDVYEVSLVDVPAYPTAKVEALRSLDAMAARLESLTTPELTGPSAALVARLRLLNL
jgi:uncharacterized protein